MTTLLYDSLLSLGILDFVGIVSSFVVLLRDCLIEWLSLHGFGSLDSGLVAVRFRICFWDWNSLRGSWQDFWEVSLLQKLQVLRFDCCRICNFDDLRLSCA